MQRGQPHVVLGIHTSSWNQTAQIRGIIQSGQVLLMRSQMLYLVLFAWYKQHILFVCLFFLCINHVLSGQTGGDTESSRRSKIMSLECHKNQVKTRREITVSRWVGDTVLRKLRFSRTLEIQVLKNGELLKGVDI